jgi:hypothetical protein
MTISTRTHGLGFLLLGALALTSCGAPGNGATPPAPQATGTQATPAASVAEQIAAFARRPELQDADSQAILQAYAHEPLALQAGQPGLSAQATGKAGYAQGVAWGSISHYAAERRSPDYSGLDWNYDGCSAPKGLGLGYSDFFRPACNVHDFGYRNLPRLISIPYWPYNKSRTDLAFLNNMHALCGTKSFWSRPACNAAATAYYVVVRDFGWAKWHR